MKIITNGNIAKYKLDDDKSVSIESDKIITSDFIIGDLNSSNATCYTNITNAPSAFIGGKYLFDGTNWTLNGDWTEPELNNGPTLE